MKKAHVWQINRSTGWLLERQFAQNACTPYEERRPHRAHSESALNHLDEEVWGSIALAALPITLKSSQKKSKSAACRIKLS
jgi:hypothetical protein